MKGGAIVPHAPIVALRAGPAAVAVADAAGAAWDALARWGCPVVILSPHGNSSGVSAMGEGDLDGFGPLGISVSVVVDAALVTDLARAWGRPILSERLDHGVVGALTHAPQPPTAIVGCTFAETTGPSPAGDLAAARGDAEALAGALLEVAATTDIAVVASAHSAASLSPAAPLTERPEGRAFDDALLDALATDNAAIAAIDEELFRIGGSCSMGPLLVWAKLFGGRPSDVLAYDAPAGVGYLVASCS